MDGPVEGSSVHRTCSVLQFSQVEETFSETRVGPMQTGAPDGLTRREGSETPNISLHSKETYFWLKSYSEV